MSNITIIIIKEEEQRLSMQEKTALQPHKLYGIG